MYFCARFLKTDMAQFTEEDKIMRRVEQRFNKGMVKYRLIEDGDKILVGLSGGIQILLLILPVLTASLRQSDQKESHRQSVVPCSR